MVYQNIVELLLIMIYVLVLQQKKPGINFAKRLRN